MAYTAEINRNDPSCFLFIIDQSGSMEVEMAGGKTKAAFVAEVLNRTLAELVGRCTKADGVRDYFDIGVIAYGNDQVQSGFGGDLAGEYMHPISLLANSPLRIERSGETQKDPSGEIFEAQAVYPVWFEPQCNGSTPMKQAFEKACHLLQEWCDDHPDSYPPTVFHVSDGRSTDGDPEDAAGILTRLHTLDGETLLFNLHADTASGSEVIFPTQEQGLPDDYARLLFRISSPFPDHLAQRAVQGGYSISAQSRFFIYKASMDFIVNFFDMGTRPANMR